MKTKARGEVFLKNSSIWILKRNFKSIVNIGGNFFYVWNLDHKVTNEKQRTGEEFIDPSRNQA